MNWNGVRMLNESAVNDTKSMLHKYKITLVTKVTKGTCVQMNTSWVQNAKKYKCK